MSQRAGTDLDLSLYLVTDAAQIAAQGKSLTDVVRLAVSGGVTAVQLREKTASTADFLRTVTEVFTVLPERVSLFVNDRVDVFLAARALGCRVTGVHLGQSDLPIALARELIGEQPVIGLSAATPEELRTAEQQATLIDYLGIGTLHPSSTKPDAPAALGIEGFRELVKQCSLPVVAIGGIGIADLPGLRRSGAAGAAVVSAICTASDPLAAAQELSRAWRTAQ
ncbi:thiamine phosphate synthase [Psychromicrobium sp. YIM B11713]|uniref:thiamine phosphate synthase n=1 Tax=Psychromicrobium sp. YIM B11713 TaxID=3145233 RepID=UPI00374FCD13